MIGRGENANNGKARWNCQCDCGKTTVVNGMHLRKKNIQSCGCLQKERSSQANSGVGNPRYGKKASLETLRKMSISHVGKCRTIEFRRKRRGENNPNWRGGINPESHQIRSSIEYRLWKEAVFARDNFTCQGCGARGGDIQAHHIERFADHPALRVAIDNGVTYCIRCHKAAHRHSAKAA